MDGIKELTEIVTFIKDKMVTKEDLADLRTELKTDIGEVKDRITAIEGKLNGVNTRIDREAERNFEQDVRLQKLESK